MKIGDTPAYHIKSLLEVAQELGASPKQLLLDAELDPQEIEDDDNRIDLTYLMRLGRSAINQTNRPDLGLIMGRKSQISSLGFAGLAAMTAQSLGQGLEIICHYEHLHSRCYRGTIQLQEQDNEAALVFYSISPYNDYNRFVVDSVLSNWAKLVSLLTQRGDLVQRVEIEFAPTHYRDCYGSVFGCPVAFNSQQNALILERNALDIELKEHNPRLHTEFKRLCDQQLTLLGQTDSVSHKVQKVLGTQLHGQTPTIDEVALKLGTPSWTLRRKLKEENTTYQTLVDEMRRDVALSYTKNTDLSFGEIAYLLGFSTPGAFQRAFKRWSGQTPGEYRKSLQNKRQ
mgnify:CR=1 FL=1